MNYEKIEPALYFHECAVTIVEKSLDKLTRVVSVLMRYPSEHYSAWILSGSITMVGGHYVAILTRAP